MFLYLIRHGEPDYSTGFLTEQGEHQAQLCAERLLLSGIDEIRSSPMQRARQTAQPLAERLGLPVRIEDWAYELGEESKTTFLGEKRVIGGLPGELLHDPRYRSLGIEDGLREIPVFAQSGIAGRYREITAGVDGMLAELGYVRSDEGHYTAETPNDRHVALFCHAGMMRVVLSHFFHIPYQYLAATLQTHFTGITVVHFSVSPVLVTYGDIGHLYADGAAPVHYRVRQPF